MKRSILLIGALVFALLPATTASAEPHGLTCAVSGNAKFKPGVTTESGDFKFSFTGQLADCMSSGEEAGTATVKARGTASGSCGFSETEGIATLKWEDGSKSTIEFTTTDVAAAVLLDGAVTKSTSKALLEGDEVISVLAFNADPNQCTDDDGLTEVEFSGQMGAGSSS